MDGGQSGAVERLEVGMGRVVVGPAGCRGRLAPPGRGRDVGDAMATVVRRPVSVLRGDAERAAGGLRACLPCGRSSGPSDGQIHQDERRDAGGAHLRGATRHRAGRVVGGFPDCHGVRLPSVSQSKRAAAFSRPVQGGRRLGG